MNKKNAMKQARTESEIFRAGSLWIVSTYHPSANMHQHSDPIPYADAQRRLREWREDRVDHLTAWITC